MPEPDTLTRVQILEGARDLLAQPGVWTQGELARTKYSRATKVTSKAACRFCAVGAIQRLAGVDNLNQAPTNHPVIGAHMELVKTIPLEFRRPNTTTADYNDARERKLPEVLAWFDRAIASARERAHSY